MFSSIRGFIITKWFVYLSQQQYFQQNLILFIYLLLGFRNFLCVLYTLMWCIFTRILSFAPIVNNNYLFVQLILWKCRWIQVRFVLFPPRSMVQRLPFVGVFSALLASIIYIKVEWMICVCVLWLIFNTIWIDNDLRLFYHIMLWTTSNKCEKNFAVMRF